MRHHWFAIIAFIPALWQGCDKTVEITEENPTVPEEGARTGIEVSLQEGGQEEERFSQVSPLSPVQPTAFFEEPSLPQGEEKNEKISPVPEKNAKDTQIPVTVQGLPQEEKKEFFPNSPLTVEEGNQTPILPQEHFRLGREAFEKRKYHEAIEHLTAAESFYSENPMLFYLRGLAALNMLKSVSQDGKVEGDQGISDLTRATQLAPGFAKARVNLARAYLAKNLAKEALEAVEGAISIDKSMSEAWNVKGRALVMLGRVEEAIEAYQTATGYDPGNGYAWNNLGLLYIQRERFEEARACLEEAIGQGLSTSYVFNNLGVVLERLGEIDQAKEAYTQAIEIDSGHEKAKMSLARVTPLAPQKPASDAETVAEKKEVEKPQPETEEKSQPQGPQVSMVPSI